MQTAVPHLIVLVGLDADLQCAIRQILSTRQAEPIAVCPDLSASRRLAWSAPGEIHLFIVLVPLQSDPTLLAEFSASLPGQPIVALLPAGSDLSRAIVVQRAGAAQIVPLPLIPDDFLHALDRIAMQFAPPPLDSCVVAVCGVAGGSGATTIALNLAYELAHPNGTEDPSRAGCLLVELARQIGSLATYLNIEPQLTSLDLLTDPGRLTPQGMRQAVTTVAGLGVIVGPYQELTPATISTRQVLQMVDLCRRLAPLVVLDVPSTFDDLQFETLSRADKVVLVGVQTVASVRTLKMVRDLLEREEGIQSMTLAINRYDAKVMGFDAGKLAGFLRVPEVLTIRNDYPALLTAANHGRPLRLVSPHSPVVADLRRLAATVLGKVETAPEPTDRLARALGRGSEPAAPRAIRVLHIEDEKVQQDLMALHLGAIRAFTIQLSHAASESEAVERFRQEAIDVVLLDYHLAQGNGLGVLRQLRRLDPLVPIIVVSGLEQPQVAAELLEAGADDFLSKQNLNSERLTTILTRAVARSDALKQRAVKNYADTTTVDDFFDRARKACAARDEHDLARGLSELQTVWPAQFSVAQIQRLVDLVSNELDCSPNHLPLLPRRALLALFMRLFGGSDNSPQSPSANGNPRDGSPRRQDQD